MRKIAICEDVEYSRRLSAYLGRSLPADVMIHSFSSAEFLKKQTEEMNLYVMGESFYQEVEETWQKTERMPEDQIILILDSVMEGAYCRWDNPALLVRLIEERLSQLSSRSLKSNMDGVRVTAVYSPFPLDIRQMIWPQMEDGALFLGFEDLGSVKEENEDFSDKKNMGDLCYYIPLRERNIVSVLQNIAVCQEGRFYVDSPDWYFDLQGLKEEDYHWFLEEIRESATYSHIYVGLGNVAIPSLSFFHMFDDAIFLDQPGNRKIHEFLKRLMVVSVEEGYMKQEQIQLLH